MTRVGLKENSYLIYKSFYYYQEDVNFQIYLEKRIHPT